MVSEFQTKPFSITSMEYWQHMEFAAVNSSTKMTKQLFCVSFLFLMSEIVYQQKTGTENVQRKDNSEYCNNLQSLQLVLDHF